LSLSQVTVSNFKSFKNLKVDLNPFNILIGANASGKTNFVDIFGFLRDITNYGLENAISMHGGSDYFPNVNIGRMEPSEFKVMSELPTPTRTIRVEKGLMRIRPYETVYSFKIRFKRRGSVEIVEDTVVQKCKVSIHTEDKPSAVSSGKITFLLTKSGKQVTFGMTTSSGLAFDYKFVFRQYLHFPFEEEEITFVGKKEIQYTSVDFFAPVNTLILEIPPFAYPLIQSLENTLSDLSIYSFAPQLSKMGVPITGKAELEEDGRNLAIVLKDILKVTDKKRKFTNLLKDLLPFVDDLAIERFADKSLLMKLKETYGKTYLPASILSEGTINITALILSLFFEEKLLKIIEEPERSIHPQIISKLVSMMRESSSKTQIIMTTHNPQFVKYANTEDILLIWRDKDGFSVVSRPSKAQKLKSFLKSDLGMDDLYVQNILEFIVKQ
jgi:predicted ATPase